MNRFEWTCPYCQHENSHLTNERMELLYCDAEEGGCDQLAVVMFTITTSTQVLKVEGEIEVSRDREVRDE